MSNIGKNNYQKIDLYLSEHNRMDICFPLEYPVVGDPPQPTISLDFTGSGLTLCGTGDTSSYVEVCGEEHDASLFCASNPVPDIFCNAISGNTFCGGFYQGHYRAEGYWDLLPGIGRGWSVELVLNQGGGCGCTGTTLNDLYGNGGIFFYWGLKSLPYCGFAMSGETSCGAAYNMPFEVVGDTGYENDFLYYTNNNVLCDPKPIAYSIKTGDCCQKAIGNALAFKVSGSTIATMVLSASGECTDSQGTYAPILEVNHSPEILGAGWNHLVIKWEPDDSECGGEKVGRLSFYVNGKRRHHIDGFREFAPYALDVHESLQVGVPFNMSVGGGTLGNLLDAHDLLQGEVCVFDFCLSCSDEISGITIDGAFSEIQGWGGDVGALKGKLALLLGDKVDVRRTGTKHESLKITVTTYKTLNNIVLVDRAVAPLVSNCIAFDPPPPCSVLEENFAGTFIGGLDCFRFYEGALKIQDIVALFGAKKEKFGISEESVCC